MPSDRDANFVTMGLSAACLRGCYLGGRHEEPDFQPSSAAQAMLVLVLLADGPYFRLDPYLRAGLHHSRIVNQTSGASPGIDFSVWLGGTLSVLILDCDPRLGYGLGFHPVLRGPAHPVAQDSGPWPHWRHGYLQKRPGVRGLAEELPGLKIRPLRRRVELCQRGTIPGLRAGSWPSRLGDPPRRNQSAELKLSIQNQIGKERVHHFVLDCSSWVVDLSADQKKQGYRVLFARCKESVRLHLHLHDFYKHADRSLFFISLHDAVLYASNVPRDLSGRDFVSSEHVNEAIEIEGEEGMPATNLITILLYLDYSLSCSG
uniref:LAM_G_DOMAIN domain-containing protein n=1 Tax=Macrostomum lignano TaxID=282301 RepID=A0A1I8FB97_9PLAT